MKDGDIPVVCHDDGIFTYQKKLEAVKCGVVDFAKEVIAAFRECERAEKSKIKLTDLIDMGIPRKDARMVRDAMVEQAGHCLIAASLHQSWTREEHENAFKLTGFIRHVEPDWVTLRIAAREHAGYCWRVALLNAFRILDLVKDDSVPLPHFWEPVNCGPEHENFTALVGSAACLMAFYYAKALAMPKAAIAIRGKQMAEAQKGRCSRLGKIIYAACAEIERRGESLRQKKISGRVMAVLEEQGKASTQNALWRVFVGEKVEVMTTKRLGKFIERYRNRKR
jgi:hypothetical protein